MICQIVISSEKWLSVCTCTLSTRKFINFMFVTKTIQFFLHFLFLLNLNVPKIGISSILLRRKCYSFIETILIWIYLCFAITLIFSDGKRLNCCIPSFLPNCTKISFITILLNTDRIIIYLQILITAIRILPFQIPLIFIYNFAYQSILLYFLKRGYINFNIIFLFELIYYRLSFGLAL